MEHLKECPDNLSPNRDYLLGMYAGIDSCFEHMSGNEQAELAEELLQFHYENPEEEEK